MDKGLRYKLMRHKVARDDSPEKIREQLIQAAKEAMDEIRINNDEVGAMLWLEEVQYLAEELGRQDLHDLASHARDMAVGEEMEQDIQQIISQASMKKTADEYTDNYSSAITELDRIEGEVQQFLSKYQQYLPVEDEGLVVNMIDEIDEVRDSFRLMLEGGSSIE